MNIERRRLGQWLLMGAALGLGHVAGSAQLVPGHVTIRNQGQDYRLPTVAPAELGTLPQSSELRYVVGPEGQLWALTQRLLITRRAGAVPPVLPGSTAPLPLFRLASVGDVWVDGLEATDIDSALRLASILQAQEGVLSVQPDICQNLPWPLGSAPALRNQRRTLELGQSLPRNGFWQPAEFDVLAAIGVRSCRSASRGQGVRVAVIDSGVDPGVPALQALRSSTRFDVDADLQPGPGAAAVEGHASGVAGLILGRAVARQDAPPFEGVAPEAALIDIRLRSGWASSLVIALGMAHQAHADVINCSFDVPWLSDAVSCLVGALAREGRQGRGAVMAVAAGNVAESLNGRHRLANHPAVLAIAASDHRGHTGWTAWGQDVFLTAPGDLLSPGPGAGYHTLSSTSAATAVVSGVAALLISVRPQATEAQLRQWLAQGAYRDPALSWPGGRNEQQGHGAVRADRSVALALKTSI